MAVKCPIYFFHPRFESGPFQGSTLKLAISHHRSSSVPRRRRSAIATARGRVPTFRRAGATGTRPRTFATSRGGPAVPDSTGPPSRAASPSLVNLIPGPRSPPEPPSSSPRQIQGHQRREEEKRRLTGDGDTFRPAARSAVSDLVTRQEGSPEAVHGRKSLSDRP